MTFAHVAILLSSTQRVEEYLVALKHFDYSWSLGYKQPITSKTIMTSSRRNERFQRPKTSWFDFVFPCAFKNQYRFENFFALIMEGIGTLWLFKFWMSQNNRDVTATISHSVSIFYWMQAKWRDLSILFSHNQNMTFWQKISILAGGAFLKSFSINKQMKEYGVCTFCEVA